MEYKLFLDTVIAAPAEEVLSTDKWTLLAYSHPHPPETVARPSKKNPGCLEQIAFKHADFNKFIRPNYFALECVGSGRVLKTQGLIKRARNALRKPLTRQHCDIEGLLFEVRQAFETLSSLLGIRPGKLLALREQWQLTFFYKPLLEAISTEVRVSPAASAEMWQKHCQHPNVTEPDAGMLNRAVRQLAKNHARRARRQQASQANQETGDYTLGNELDTVDQLLPDLPPSEQEVPIPDLVRPTLSSTAMPCVPQSGDFTRAGDSSPGVRWADASLESYLLPFPVLFPEPTLDVPLLSTLSHPEVTPPAARASTAPVAGIRSADKYPDVYVTRKRKPNPAAPLRTSSAEVILPGML